MGDIKPTTEDLALDLPHLLQKADYARAALGEMGMGVPPGMMAHLEGVLRRAIAAEAQRDALIGLDPAGVDELLERWDRTAPDIQRGIVARFSVMAKQAQEEANRLREALAFYADSSNWIATTTGYAGGMPVLETAEALADEGKLARVALGREPGAST